MKDNIETKVEEEPTVGQKIAGWSAITGIVSSLGSCYGIQSVAYDLLTSDMCRLDESISPGKWEMAGLESAFVGLVGAGATTLSIVAVGIAIGYGVDRVMERYKAEKIKQ